MGIHQVKKTSIGDQVYEQLQGQLARGEWKPGDKLPSENELATALGVSRITVRQAIQRLATLGLLETKLGEGTFVRTFTPGMMMTGMIPAAYLGEHTLLEVLEFRRIIEIPTAELAAAKATEADVNTLEDIFARMVAAQQRREGQVFFHADLDFHLELGNITRNSLVIETLSILRGILEVAMERIVEVRGDTQGIHYHRLLLEAVRQGDTARCRQVMAEHIDDTIAGIRKHLEK